MTPLGEVLPPPPPPSLARTGPFTITGSSWTRSRAHTRMQKQSHQREGLFKHKDKRAEQNVWTGEEPSRSAALAQTLQSSNELYYASFDVSREKQPCRHTSPVSQRPLETPVLLANVL